MIAIAKDFAINAHAKVSHYYDKRSYAFHLELASIIADSFQEVIEKFAKFTIVEQAVWLHDTIEDCRLTYNDLNAEFGAWVAEVVYLVADEKGRNRKERHNHKYYTGIASMEEAIVVKLCDNIANVLYSCYTSSSMFKKYKSEYAEIKQYLYREELKSMFDFLESVYDSNQLSEYWIGIIKSLETKYPQVFL